MLRCLTRARAVLVGYVVLSVAPFAIAAAKSSFWQPRHSTAPVATVIFLAIVLALVVGRYRWAWVLLVVFYLAEAVPWLFDARRFTPRLVLGLALDVALLMLLFSRTMRRRLRRPVGVSTLRFRHRQA